MRTQAMTAMTSQAATTARRRPSEDLPARAARLETLFEDCGAAQIVEWATWRLFPGEIAAVTSFGAESAALLKLVADADPSTPVIFIDTGKHFPETLRYRDRLVDLLGLTDVRTIAPDPHALAALRRVPRAWESDPDRCCDVRRVQPLEPALSEFSAWFTGRKRYHGAAREKLRRAEAVDGRIKLNPLADWPREAIAAYLDRHGLPVHPLVREGYASIGCAPCTDRPIDRRDPRSGRWAGRAKTECGIHLPGQPRE